MKVVMAAICGAILFTSGASAQNKAGGSAQQTHPVPQISPQPAQSWTTVFSTETRFFAWHNNFAPPDGNTGAGRGSEIYVPFAMQLSGKPADALNLDFIARGGWVRAVQSTAGRSGEVQTITDTAVSATASYLGVQGMQPFVSLNMNLPTGKSALFGTDANARMDPDLVDISTFGEGFNVGPTAGINFPIAGSLLVTASLGYTWRGKFEQESNFDPFNSFLTSTVNPGDNLTPTVAVNYQTGPLSIGLTASLTWETPSSVDDLQTFKPGKRYLLALQSSYAWPQQLGATTLSASFAHFESQSGASPRIKRAGDRNAEFELGCIPHWPAARDSDRRVSGRPNCQLPVSQPQRLQLRDVAVCAGKNTLVGRPARAISAEPERHSQCKDRARLDT